MTLHAAIQNVRFYLRDMEQAGLFADDQLVAAAPPVPPDGGSPAAITISDLRAILERHPNDRWNIEEDGAALLVCRGDHERAAGCSFDRYVPADHANSEIGKSDNAAEPIGGTIKSTYLEGRMDHWLGEAQRLAALVTALGGNPEPDAPQPLTAPGEERYRNKEAQAPAGVVDHLRARLEGISALWAANGQPDRGQIAFLLRVAESYVNLPVLSAAAWERAEICKVLGIVDRPGVPLKHVIDILDRKAKAYAREVAVLRMWDPANLTERQELDRLRRGWGPSSPTERMRRRKDVNGCIQALTGALTELAVPEEDMEALGDEANAYIEAAHDRLQKHYTAILAISSELGREPQEWPDIRAAEERGALAMREILKARVSGLKIMEKPSHPQWEIENAAFDGAVFQIETAPMPRDYHGNAEDKVAKILANEKPEA